MNGENQLALGIAPPKMTPIRAWEDWLGFDTLHAGDWWPGTAEFRLTRHAADRTWTEDEVAAETERMAESIVRLAAAAFLPVGGAR